MAYRRRYRKRRRKPMTIRRAAGQLLDVSTRTGVKYLKSKLGLNTEMKFLDTQTTTSINTTLAAVNEPLVIPQGDTEGSRDGNSCRLVSMNSNIVIDNSSNAGDTSIIRLMCVYTPNTNADPPTVNQVLDTKTAINSPYFMDRVGYNVIFDKYYTLSGGANAQVNGRTKVHDHFVHRPLDHQIKFTTGDTTGTRDNLLNGDVCWYAFCDSYTTGQPTVNIWSRVRFVDN